MKPGAFSQLYIHLVFSPKYRQQLLTSKIRNDVFGYISGIITNRKNKSIIINGMPDHIHILIGLNPNEKISDIVGCIKRESSAFINEKHLTLGKFRWQDGYGAFSYGKSQLSNIYNYILNQEVHHKKRSFKEEYVSFLKKYEISYDNKYLFEFFE